MRTIGHSRWRTDVRLAIALVLFACSGSTSAGDAGVPFDADCYAYPAFRSPDGASITCEADFWTEPSQAYPDGLLVTDYCSSLCNDLHYNAIRIAPDGALGCARSGRSDIGEPLLCGWATCTRFSQEPLDVGCQP